MNISDYLRTALINHSLGVASYTSPSNLYAALYTTSPTSAGGGVQVTNADYARVVTGWNVASVGTTTNSIQFRFPATGVAASNWGTVVALGLFDAPTVGNLLFFGPLSAAAAMSINAYFAIAINGLTISLS